LGLGGDQTSGAAGSPDDPFDRAIAERIMLSPTVEDYLKAIYKLQVRHDPPVTTSAVADAMEVSSASVTNMVQRLDELGLVVYESYRGATLTEAGTKVALEIIRHHRLLELYLKEVMDYSWEQLHEEAEHLEHHISEEFETKLEELLDYPTHDPHGHPIPARDGTVAEVRARPLAHVEAGATVQVHHLEDADPKLLHHLEDLGLMPRVRVDVEERAPFDGPLTLTVHTPEGANTEVVGRTVAAAVFVSDDASESSPDGT
jgi:DtxR family Mn-dependent transcriptional regulator